MMRLIHEYLSSIAPAHMASADRPTWYFRAAFVLALAAVLPVRVQAITFTSLGDLPGGTFRSNAAAISGDGSVVVGSSSSESGTEAFRWTMNERMAGLGFLAATGEFESDATAVSFDGTVVVGHATMEGGTRAFRWTEADGMTPLPMIGPRFPATAADVSADGRTIVGSTGTPFRWIEGKGITGLGLPDDLASWDWGEAMVVSPDGAIVYGTLTSALNDEFFRWEEASGFTVFLDLFFSKIGAVTDVTADGLLLVGTDLNANEENRDIAFRWSEEGGLERLFEIVDSTGVISDRAFGVSADGTRIVGRTRGKPGGCRPRGVRRGHLGRDARLAEHRPDSDRFRS